MHLLQVYLQFERRCKYVMHLIDEAIKSYTIDYEKYEIYINHAILTLHDEWASRCRSIILKSAIGGVRIISGRILPKRQTKPLAYLREKWANNTKMDNTWEPQWYIPSVAIRAARILDIDNLSEISNGLGASITAEQIRITRNVIAHTLPETWIKLRKLEIDLGHIGNESPAEFSMCRIHNTGSRHLEDWVIDLKACIHAAIQ